MGVRNLIGGGGENVLKPGMPMAHHSVTLLNCTLEMGKFYDMLYISQ